MKFRVVVCTVAVVVALVLTFHLGKATAQEPTPPNIVIPASTDAFNRDNGPKIGAFVPWEIRFDESASGKKPNPRIPKGWRFIGVANGEKINSNTLWFQGQDGTVYLLTGFTADHQFLLDNRVQVLGSE